jgi:cation diffusion facilitator CzcD-associated flavoprotein CzcO
VKTAIIDMVKQHLGPDYDVATHFTPKYNPWDQRLCLVPDADLFDAIKRGSASVVTDHIDRFTPTGLKLKSGQALDADIVVTATGLNLQLLSGLKVSLDGAPVDISKTMSYKGMMYSGVPNLASSFGYTNASWTLKADLTCEYVCRVLNYMDRRGVKAATPAEPAPDVQEAPWLDFSSGYVTRSINQFPRQGLKKPWKLYQNYALDLVTLKFGAVDDGTLRFSAPGAAKKAA